MPRSQDGRWAKPLCRKCGKPFAQRRPDQEYCSRECSNRANPGTGGRKPAAGLEPRVCPACGEKFQPYRANQVACSRGHRKQLPEIRERANELRRTPEFRERKNEWRRTTPAQVERVRADNRRRVLARGGWTPELYANALAEQAGLCKICGSPPKPEGVRAESKLHADHDHATRQRRDLLCSGCNKGLGCFGDDPVRLRAAAAYVERHREAGLT